MRCEFLAKLCVLHPPLLHHIPSTGLDLSDTTQYVAFKLSFPTIQRFGPISCQQSTLLHTIVMSLQNQTFSVIARCFHTQMFFDSNKPSRSLRILIQAWLPSEPSLFPTKAVTTWPDHKKQNTQNTTQKLQLHTSKMHASSQLRKVITPNQLHQHSILINKNKKLFVTFCNKQSYRNIRSRPRCLRPPPQALHRVTLPPPIPQHLVPVRQQAPSVIVVAPERSPRPSPKRSPKESDRLPHSLEGHSITTFRTRVFPITKFELCVHWKFSRPYRPEATNEWVFTTKMGRGGRDQIFTLFTAFVFYGRGQGVNQHLHLHIWIPVPVIFSNDVMNTDCDVFLEAFCLDLFACAFSSTCWV